MRYTQEQISTALVLLKATGSPDKVVQTLGYPSAPMLYHWRKKYPEYYDVPNQKHWIQAPTELKHTIIKRCLIKGEPVKLVAKEIGYTLSLIYRWIRKYREKAVIIDALKNKYSLPDLLKKLNLAKAAIIIKKKPFMQKINTLIFAKESYNCFIKIVIYLVTGEFTRCFIVKV